MDIKQWRVASISLKIIQSTGPQRIGETTYIPSPLVWSRLEALGDIVDVVVCEI
jgi:hypothetical protein